MLVESDALCLHPYRKKIMNSEELEYSTPVRGAGAKKSGKVAKNWKTSAALPA